MKKIFSFAATLFGLLTFCGCGDDSAEKSNRSVPAHIYNEYRRDSLNNLKQLGLAIMMYSSAHDDNAPESLAKLAGYVGNQVLVAKFDQQHAEPTVNADPEKIVSSYIYIGNIGKLTDLADIAATPLAFEDPALLPADHHELVVLYADGNTQVVKIKNVDKKNCREIVTLLTGKLKDSAVKAELLKNAAIADQSGK